MNVYIKFSEENVRFDSYLVKNKGQLITLKELCKKNKKKYVPYSKSGTNWLNAENLIKMLHLINCDIHWLD